MARNYQYHEITEMGSPKMFMDNKPHPRFGYEIKMLENTNPQLMTNFFKVAQWIEENCPNLNGKFECRHNPYYKIHLNVENGKAYLETGSHSPSYECSLSTTETAVYTQGSCQGAPYAFKDKFFFRNDRLEEFLSQWPFIKTQIINKNKAQNRVYSNNFIA